MGSLTNLKRDIEEGKWDEKFDNLVRVINRSIRSRKTVMNASLIKGIHPGDRVKLRRGSFKPKYVQGLLGTVEKIEGDIVWVKFDTPVKGRTKLLGAIGITPEYVEVIEAN